MIILLKKEIAIPKNRIMCNGIASTILR